MIYKNKIKDLNLYQAGRREIDLAEQDMPGLLALRQYFGRKKQKPLKGACIAGSLHLTAQSAVLIETLEYLGAKTRFAPSNRYSTQDGVAAALVKSGFSIFGWSGLSEEEYRWCYVPKFQARPTSK